MWTTQFDKQAYYVNRVNNNYESISELPDRAAKVMMPATPIRASVTPHVNRRVSTPPLPTPEHIQYLQKSRKYLKKKVPIGARHPANVDHARLLVGSPGQVRPAVRLRCLPQTFQLGRDHTLVRTWPTINIYCDEWSTIAIDCFSHGLPHGFVARAKVQLRVALPLLLMCKQHGLTVDTNAVTVHRVEASTRSIAL